MVLIVVLILKSEKIECRICRKDNNTELNIFVGEMAITPDTDILQILARLSKHIQPKKSKFLYVFND